MYIWPLLSRMPSMRVPIQAMGPLRLRLRVSRVTHTCGAGHSTSTQWYQLLFCGVGALG